MWWNELEDRRTNLAFFLFTANSLSTSEFRKCCLRFTSAVPALLCNRKPSRIWKSNSLWMPRSSCQTHRYQTTRRNTWELQLKTRANPISSNTSTKSPTQSREYDRKTERVLCTASPAYPGRFRWFSRISWSTPTCRWRMHSNMWEAFDRRSDRMSASSSSWSSTNSGFTAPPPSAWSTVRRSAKRFPTCTSRSTARWSFCIRNIAAALLVGETCDESREICYRESLSTPNKRDH